jgi:hypothetical protein
LDLCVEPFHLGRFGGDKVEEDLSRVRAGVVEAHAEPTAEEPFSAGLHRRFDTASLCRFAYLWCVSAMVVAH